MDFCPFRGPGAPHTLIESIPGKKTCTQVCTRYLRYPSIATRLTEVTCTSSAPICQGVRPSRSGDVAVVNVEGKLGDENPAVPDSQEWQGFRPSGAKEDVREVPNSTSRTLSGVPKLS